MTEQAPDSLERSSSDGSVYAANLLRFYSFDLGERTIADLLAQWQDYPENWVRLALIEALYQGRYKAVSVEQILAFWQRRGQPLHRFNHDFERLICNKLPRNLTLSTRSVQEPSLIERSRPQPSNVVNFPTTLKRTPHPSIVAPEPPPEVAAMEGFPSVRLREVLEAESDLATPGETRSSTAPLPAIKTAPQLGTIAEPAQPPPVQPPRKTTPLSMPDFGLTPPHLSLKLRVQLAALYQPNWIMPATGNHPFHQLAVAAKSIASKPKPESTDQSTDPQQPQGAVATPVATPEPQPSKSIESDPDNLKSDLW